MTDQERQETIYTDAVKELVAVGAAIASNCEICFKFHYNEARKLGVSKADIRLAVDTALTVKESPARSISELADKYLVDASAKVSPCSCCGPSDGGPAPEGSGGNRSCC